MNEKKTLENKRSNLGNKNCKMNFSTINVENWKRRHEDFVFLFYFFKRIMNYSLEEIIY